MNFRREHLPLSQRTHYVITNGGGQPNIVPGIASVWYYFRDYTFDRVKELFDIGNQTADAAAMATDTTVEHKLLGFAAPNYGNKPMAELAAGQYRGGGHAEMDGRRPGLRQAGAGNPAAQGRAACATRSRR